MSESNPVGKSIIAAAPVNAPGAASRMLLRLVDFGIDGNEQLGGAKEAAGSHLERHGSVEAAIDTLIATHCALGGTQGFVTNLGGLATVWIGAPANVAGITVLQGRLVGAIAHLRGYDLDDSRVRHAVLMTLLGERIVSDLVASGDLPGTPLVVATAPGVDRELEQVIAQRVMTAMLTSTGGKQLVGMVAKRVPVIGGGVGLITDGWNTFAVGRYAREQFVNRRPMAPLTSHAHED